MEKYLPEIRAYALLHYEEGGWNIVYEAWEDRDILEVIEGCSTLKEAIAKVNEVASAIQDYEDDIAASAF